MTVADSASHHQCALRLDARDDAFALQLDIFAVKLLPAAGAWRRYDQVLIKPKKEQIYTFRYTLYYSGLQEQETLIGTTHQYAYDVNEN